MSSNSSDQPDQHGYSLELYDDDDLSSASTTGQFSPCPSSPFPGLRMTPKGSFMPPNLALTPAVNTSSTEHKTREVSFHHSLFSRATAGSVTARLPQDDSSTVFQFDEEHFERQE
jgi:hypothetical protein